VAAISALAVAGCSLDTVLDPPGARELTPPLFDYRHLVIDSEIVKIMKKNATGQLEISGLRRSEGSQPGDWMTCLRGWQNGRRAHMALFFRDNAIVESRGGVMIDGCEQDSFSMLLPDVGLY
jgi:hypothetical protein